MHDQMGTPVCASIHYPNGKIHNGLDFETPGLCADEEVLYIHRELPSWCMHQHSTLPQRVSLSRRRWSSSCSACHKRNYVNSLIQCVANHHSFIIIQTAAAGGSANATLLNRYMHFEKDAIIFINIPSPQIADTPATFC